MKSPENGVIKTVTTAVLRGRAGSSPDAETLLLVTRRAYDDLAGVLVPLIGDVGLTALSARAMHLAQREYPAEPGAETTSGDGPPESLERWLQQLDQSLAPQAASWMLSVLGELLGTFIGESLTMRLLRKAWPDGFPDHEIEETHP
jgi:hypothetical protein